MPAMRFMTDGRFASEFSCREILGSGALGSVRAATRGSDDKQVCLKLVPRATSNATVLLAEAAFLHLAGQGVSGHIVAFLDLVYTPTHVVVVMEELRGPPLNTLARMEKELLGSLLHQAARALKVIHGCAIAHRDVKPANMRLTGQSVLKLLDFGSAALADRPLFAWCGSSGFRAPEVEQCRPYGLSCDLWSLGMTAVALSCEPVHELPEAQIFMCMLQPDPTLRPSAEEVCLDSWLSVCDHLRD